MPPPTQRRIGDIEALRAFAILLVLAHHFRSGVIWWPTDWKDLSLRYFNGGAGVDLFLVVSGFVIGRSLLGRLETARTRGRFRVEVVAFWLRRFWRLLPSAWLWLLVPLALATTYNDSGAFGTLRGNLQSAAAAFLHVANFYFAWTISQSAPELDNSVFVYWSLSLEEQFYLFLPLLVLLAGRRLPLLLGALIVAQLVYREHLYIWQFRTEGLFAGLLLARAQGSALVARLRPRWLDRVWARVLFVNLSLIALTFASSRYVDPSDRSIPVLLIGVGLVWAATYNADYIVRASWLRHATDWLGTRSYSLYLIHVPAFAFVRESFHRFAPRTPGDHWSGSWIAAYLVAALVFPFLVADLNYRLLEVPLRRRGRVIADRFLERRSRGTSIEG